MTDEPTTISKDASLRSALIAMRNGKFPRLLVVESAGKLVGMISVDDALMRIAEELSLIGELLMYETPRASPRAVVDVAARAQALPPSGVRPFRPASIGPAPRGAIGAQSPRPSRQRPVARELASPSP